MKPCPSRRATVVRLRFAHLLALSAITVAPAAAATAQEPPAEPRPQQQEQERRDLQVIDRVMVIGNAARLDEIPGSAHLLNGFQLRQAKVGYDDIHQMLLRIPGVNVQEEEGYGLRPNIGLRGSGTERSSRISLMEDGVPIAPAPYAAPSAYYFPTAGRMEAIEVRKGSSQVKFGPRTTGGALNLVSTSVPAGMTVRGNAAFGSDATGKAHLAIGEGAGNWGWLAETYQLRTSGFKRVDGGGDAGFVLQDYLGKLRYRTDLDADRFQELELKFGYTRQDADETYLGLTQADFDADPLRRYAGSQHDNILSSHRQIQARHFVTLGADLDLTTVAYRNDFSRNWYKIQSVNGVGIASVLDHPDRYSSELAILRGATSPDDAIQQRHNDRDYYSQGVQSVLGARLDTGALRHRLELGVGYHADQEDRFQSEDGYRMLDGRKLLTSVGAPGSQANRVADARAWKAFVQDRIEIGGLGITPGVRYERIELIRTDYAKTDPERRAPSRIRDKTLDVVVAGVGVDYGFGSGTSVFAGLHRGFAPPGPGAADPVDPETSRNWELGLRQRTATGSLQVTGFLTDYVNLLGADTLSSGGTGSGDQFNGGAATVYGLELGGSADLSGAVGASGLRLPVAFSYTWTRGRFDSSFDSAFDPWGTVTAGDRLPYLAEHQAFVSAGLADEGWDLIAESRFGSAMRTVAGRGPLGPGEGTDAHAVVNLSGSVRLTDRVRLQGSLQNLLDATYVVARAPAGARPGLPRTAMIGVRIER